MRIDAIVCCVGEMYAAQLARSLPIWLDTLDSLTVVTAPGDPVHELTAQYGAFYSHWTSEGTLRTKTLNNRMSVVESKVFTQYGADFNKAAALNVAYDAADPQDWVLHVDADIIPPPDWRKITEQRAERGCLSGVHRYDETTGQRLDEKPLYPYGYFQLWHTSDPCSWRWPLFEPWHPDGGSYDANFTDLWPRDKQRDLGFKVIHQGERRTNWCGTTEEAKAKMKERYAPGYRKVRMRRKAGVGRLPVPTKQVALNADSDPELAAGVLRECRQRGPFG